MQLELSNSVEQEINSELVQETQELLDDLRRLEEVAIQLHSLLNLSGEKIEHVDANIETSESEYQKANYKLFSLRNFNTSVKTVASLAAIGSIAGCYFGSAILTGRLVGAISGAAVTLGSTKVIDYYNAIIA